MSIKSLLSVVFIMQYAVAVGQIDTILWQQCFGTQGDDQTYAIERTLDGYLLGIDIETSGPGITNYHGGSDAWILNIDTIGNLIWERCYGGSSGDGCEKIINIDDSSYYLINYTVSDDGDIQNERPGTFWIVKINAAGDIIWENCYGGSVMGEAPNDAILMPDWGLIVIGRFGSSPGGDITTHYGGNDIWACRINASGVLRWEKTFGNQGNDNLLKIRQAGDSTYYMIGTHWEEGGMIECDYSGIWGDVWIVEIDVYGNIVNQWCYGGSHNDLGRDIIKINDGYVFVASTTSNDGDVSGFHGVGGSDYTDIWVCKVDQFGMIVWQRCLGGYEADYPVHISRTENSGYIIFGNTWSVDGDVTGNHSVNGNCDLWAVKVDSAGQLEWEHCFGGLGEDRFWGTHAVVKEWDYDYVLAAQSRGASLDVECQVDANVYYDAWILEVQDCSYYLPGVPSMFNGPDTLCTTTDSTAIYAIEPVPGAVNYEWVLSPENAGTLIPDSLNAQVTWDQLYEGTVTISARSFNECGHSEWSVPFTTFVYSCVGTDEMKYKDHDVSFYPNPAWQWMIIDYHLPEGNFSASLIISDFTGKTIQTFTLDGQKGSLKWQTEQVQPGLYFYTITAGSYHGAGKLVVIAK